MKRCVIREANLYEQDDIMRFYRENSDPHVMPRAEEAVKAAIRDGIFIVGLDTDIQKDGHRLFAASAVYTIECADTSGSLIPLKELGGALVRREYRGFGVGEIFHPIRILHEFLLDRNGFKECFGAVIWPNKPSIDNLTKAGLVPWPDPPLALQEERAAYAGAGQEIRYFRFPPKSLPHAAAALLAIANRGTISRDHDGRFEMCQLVLDLQLLKWYRPVLEALANEDFSCLDNAPVPLAS